MSLFRLLFICKRRHGYWADTAPDGASRSSGLGNSVRFIVDKLNASGVAAKAVEVVDNNSIEREIVAFRPTHVIVEALWVVPEKFDLLKRLYPRLQWIVRLHSQLPFLASEGIAMQWIAGYLERDIEVMCNARTAMADLRQVATDYGRPEVLVSYGPNYYPPHPIVERPKPPVRRGEIHIGCFGALRQLKNHLTQAIAAITFANQTGRRLYFHVNAGRSEGGDPVWRNLRALFDGSAGPPGAKHVLVAEPWRPWDAFRAYLRSSIDLSMQVSLSETFNIVAADSVAAGVPTVVSPEIGWLGPYAQAQATNMRGIVAVLAAAFPAQPSRLARQFADLATWSQSAERVWVQRFG